MSSRHYQNIFAVGFFSMFIGIIMALVFLGATKSESTPYLLKVILFITFIILLLVGLFLTAYAAWDDKDLIGKKRKKEEKKSKSIYKTLEVCGQCGGELVFDHTSDKGTIVAVHADRLPCPRKVRSSIHKNATMPFLWVYFRCVKGCDWQLCTTSRSKAVFLGKRK